MCLTASFLATGGFKFRNACMVYKQAYLNTLLLLHSAFIMIYALPGEDWAKRGGWRPCMHLKIVMEITLLIIDNHGKIMVLCFLFSVGTLIFR